MKHALLPLVVLCMLSVQACAAGQKETLYIQKGNGKDIALDVEIADEPEEWGQGLMNRKHLDQDSGMLFVFPELRRPSFWMKNTLIPLDMIFIGPDNRIAQIHANALPHDLTHITPEKKAIAVLEINGGMAEKLGLRVGNRLSMPVSANSDKIE